MLVTSELEVPEALDGLEVKVTTPSGRELAQSVVLGPGGKRLPATLALEWVRGELQIPAGRSVGVPLSFIAGYVPGTEHGSMNNLLQAGTYYLQIIYLRAFAAGVPLDDNAVQSFYTHFDRGQYFRSNSVRIDFENAEP